MPVDALQLEEADVEPGRQQAAQVGLQGREQVIVVAVIEQERAQIDQEFPPIGDRSELG